MKKYIKLGLFVLSLAPVNHIQSMPEPVHEANRVPLDIKQHEKPKIFAKMLHEEHSTWLHSGSKEKLNTRADVKAPGSDIEWGKHIFSGDQKMANLGKKISTTAQRVSDWLSDWWNADKESFLSGMKNKSRRTIVNEGFKKHSDSNDTNKQLDDETKKAFTQLRPDIQLEYINKFVETEYKIFDDKRKALSKDITTINENIKAKGNIINNQIFNLKKELKYTFKNTDKNDKDYNDITKDEASLKKFKNDLEKTIHRTAELNNLIERITTIEQLFTDKKNLEGEKALKETLINEIEPKSYYNRLDKFSKEIDSALTENNQNIHLEYNLQTKKFEFHTGANDSRRKWEQDIAQRYPTNLGKPLDIDQLRKSQSFDEFWQSVGTSNLSGKPKEKIAAEKRQKELDALELKFTDLADTKTTNLIKKFPEKNLSQKEKQERDKITYDMQKELKNIYEQFVLGKTDAQSAQKQTTDVIQEAEKKAQEVLAKKDSPFTTTQNDDDAAAASQQEKTDHQDAIETDESKIEQVLTKIKSPAYQNKIRGILGDLTKIFDNIFISDQEKINKIMEFEKNLSVNDQISFKIIAESDDPKLKDLKDEYMKLQEKFKKLQNQQQSDVSANPSYLDNLNMRTQSFNIPNDSSAQKQKKSDDNLDSLFADK
jgi:hypothetical protein